MPKSGSLIVARTSRKKLLRRRLALARERRHARRLRVIHILCEPENALSSRLHGQTVPQSRRRNMRKFACLTILLAFASLLLVSTAQAQRGPNRCGGIFPFQCPHG